MSSANGHTGLGAPVAVARPVVLVRYRPGVTGETARTVHVIPMPTDERAGVVGALCGAALMVHDIEIVTVGEGMPCRAVPCTLCVLSQALGTVPTGESDAEGLAAGGVAYHGWGWPVTLHRDQVQLSLHREVSAWAIPTPLGTEVTEILTRRRCVPPVLTHPYAPDHHIVLTGERYGVPLLWPHQVHLVSGVLLLPPTLTPRGPITWIQPPQQDSLQLCREIDLFGALRTTLRNSPADGPPFGDDPRR